jgi:hypothetical protein
LATIQQLLALFPAQMVVLVFRRDLRRTAAAAAAADAQPVRVALG